VTPRLAAPVTQPRGARVSWLDGIRGGAAVFVVLHHMWLTAWPGFPSDNGPWWLGWLLYGHMAVAIFIVVSGFSLALVPLSNGGKLPGGVRRFVHRRAWRILPAYWAALILSVVVTALFLRPDLGPGAVGQTLVVHGLLLQDVVWSETPNGALWSIAVEWQIYFVFPLILVLARRTTIATAVMAFAFIVIAAHAIAGIGAPLDKIDHLTPQFLALFAMGVLAVQLGAGERAASLRRPAGVVALAAFVAFVLLALTEGSEWAVAHFFWMDLLFGIGVAGLLTLMHAGGAAPVRRVLASKTAIWLGLFSYSIYLVHDPLLGVLSAYAFAPLGLSPLATFGVTLAVGLPLILAACYGFHLLFEAPFLRRRDRSALRALSIGRVRAPRRGRADVPGPQAAPGEQPAV
jgi:peptidoglycan/LPS O-acetylase OafA/YrhL